MQVQTFTPTYPARPARPAGKLKRSNDAQGHRICIRHDLLDAAEAVCPSGMTLKAFLNATLEKALLGD